MGEQGRSAASIAPELGWLVKNLPGLFCAWLMDFGPGDELCDIRVGYFNDAFAALFGRGLEEVRGKSVREVWGPERTFDTTRATWREVALTGTPRSYQFERDGRQWTCSAYRPGPARDVVCTVFEDVTERQAARRKIEHLVQEQRSILNTVGAGITYIKNREEQWVNPAFLEMFGYEEREVLGASTLKFYADSADSERVGAEGYARLRAGEIYSTEARMRRKDGSLIWCTITGQAVDPRDPNEGSIWTLLDITERREMEDLLRRERAFTDAVLESVPGLLYVYDDEGRLVRWNKQHEMATGHTAAELSGMHLLDWFKDDAEAAASITEAVRRLAVDGQAQAEAELRTKDGRRVRYFFTAVNLKVNGRNYFVGVGLDVTDRARVEESLRHSQERLELAFLGAELGSWDWNIQTGAADYDGRWAGMLGYRVEEILPLNLSWASLVHPDDMPEVQRHLSAHLNGDTPFYESEHRLRHKDGHWVWVLSRGKVVARDADGRPLRAAGTHVDITERRRTQAALQASEERFKRLVQNSKDMILVLDAAGVCLSASGPVDETVGYAPEDLVGQSGLMVLHPDDRDRATTMLAKVAATPGLSDRIEYRVQHNKTGQWISLEAVGINLLEDPFVRGVVINVRDITQRKQAEEERGRLQEQLQQALKMEAVGRLAGGIAHDFNNLLTTITGNLELARMELPPNDPLGHNLEEMHRAAERAAGLTRQLLAFSRRQIIEPKVVDLNELVDNLQKMLVRVIGEDVSLQTHLASNLGAVKVDPGQFEQVLVNLAVNARDAMPDGGRLLIDTANVELDEAYCASHPEARPGSFVMLAVSDTGHGMSEEVRRRIFEPFFTTKPKGRGTGLGLATIFGTVKQAGGTIQVYSEVGLGTSFKIYLPRVSQAPESLSAEPPGTQALGGKETILVVEDERSVRDLALLLLRRLGYQVLHAASGEEALALAAGYTQHIDLLMTDVVMPGMNGRELGERLHLLHPETAVLFTSGYTEDIVVHHGVVEESLNFIGKPYTMQGLAGKIREVLALRLGREH